MLYIFLLDGLVDEDVAVGTEHEVGPFGVAELENWDHGIACSAFGAGLPTTNQPLGAKVTF